MNVSTQLQRAPRGRRFRENLRQQGVIYITFKGWNVNIVHL